MWERPSSQRTSARDSQFPEILITESSSVAWATGAREGTVKHVSRDDDGTTGRLRSHAAHVALILLAAGLGSVAPAPQAAADAASAGGSSAASPGRQTRSPPTSPTTARAR